MCRESKPSALNDAMQSHIENAALKEGHRNFPKCSAALARPPPPRTKSGKSSEGGARLQPEAQEGRFVSRNEADDDARLQTNGGDAFLEILHDRRERLPDAGTRHRMGQEGEPEERIHDVPFSGHRRERGYIRLVFPQLASLVYRRIPLQRKGQPHRLRYDRHGDSRKVLWDCSSIA